MSKNAKRKFWSFKAKSETEGELMLYGDISSSSWWGDEVTPKQFKQDLDALGDITTLNVYLNSDGGDVFAGQAIYSMLKRHSATKNVYIDGLAASIASLIAMAGDKVIMPSNAMLMIHNPWTWCVGNSNDFRKMAEDMDKIRESMLVTYEAKSGMKQEDIINLLDAETWMTAQEAVDYGFADEIEEEKQVAASLKGGILMLNGVTMDLGRFKNVPKLAFVPKVAEAPNQPEPQSTSKPVIKNEGKTLSSDNEDRIRQCVSLLGEILEQLEDPEDDDPATGQEGPNQGDEGEDNDPEAKKQTEIAKRKALLALELVL